MFYPKVTTLASHIQIVYVQSIAKLYSCSLLDAERDDAATNDAATQSALYNGNGFDHSAKSGDGSKVDKLNSLMLDKLPMFVQSPDLEVQERACSFMELVRVVHELRKSEQAARPAQLIALLFTGELNPVALKAQRKVPLPEGLNLDAWINDPPSNSEGEEIEDFSEEIDESRDANADSHGRRDLSGRPTVSIEMFKLTRLAQII